MGSGWRQLEEGRGSWRLITAAAPGLRKEQSPKTNRGHSSPDHHGPSAAALPSPGVASPGWTGDSRPARKFFSAEKQTPNIADCSWCGTGKPIHSHPSTHHPARGTRGFGMERGTQNRRGSGVPGGSVCPSGGTAVNSRLLPGAAKPLARARRASRFFPRVCAGNQPCNLDILAGARPGTQTLGAARPRGESVSAAHTWAPQELTLEPVRDRLLPSSPPSRWAAPPPNPRPRH